tara:strand:- start:8 stop:505 length:498 start_codon:yes stop_codon:yes gene_type:complete
MAKLIILVLFFFYNASAEEKSELVFQKILKNHGEIELIDLNNNTIKLSDYKKDLLIINFWATWCVPCIKEIPELLTLEADFDDKLDILFVSVGLNPSDDIRFFLKKHNYKNVDVFLDDELKISKKIEVTTIPSTIILDKSRNEIIRSSGYVKWDSQEIYKIIKDL